MKCLLCKFNSKNKVEIEKHYIIFHNVDKENNYFKKLLKENNDVFVGERCSKYNEFIPTAEFKKSHNFLKHYKDGKELISDEKPISIVEIGNNIRKYEIKYDEHSSYYDFFNSEKVVDDFYRMFEKGLRERTNIFLSDVDFQLKIFSLF